MTLYLSRLRLKRDPGTVALKGLIDPEGPTALDAHHRLIWTLFADRADRRRDFLWRADGKGRFYTLSARAPVPAPLFEPPETRAFDPDLAEGDRLSFVLRANATKALKRKGRGQRADVVMALLHELPGKTCLPEGETSERPARRMDLARRAALEWMEGQGARAGFRLVQRKGDTVAVPDLDVQDYSVMALPGRTGPRKGQPQFGILDLSGTLTVTDPAAFLPALARGFGRAKAFGCGLMLIRRA